MNYITGENIQLSCDLILGDLEDEWSVAKNPRILSEASNKVIYLQKIDNSDRNIEEKHLILFDKLNNLDKILIF